MDETIAESDLPRLQSIELGKSTLEGNLRGERWTMEDGMFNFKNTLTMKGG